MLRTYLRPPALSTVAAVLLSACGISEGRELNGKLQVVTTTRIAVTSAFTVARGRKTFQPSAMNWS